MLNETDRRGFRKLAEKYKNSCIAVLQKEQEIRGLAEKCGARTDCRKLAKIILPLPDPSLVRTQLIQRYYELTDEPPVELGSWPPLEEKTQIAADALASTYDRLLKEKRRLHDEVFNLANERGVFENLNKTEQLLDERPRSEEPAPFLYPQQSM